MVRGTSIAPATILARYVKFRMLHPGRHPAARYNAALGGVGPGAWGSPGTAEGMRIGAKTPRGSMKQARGSKVQELARSALRLNAGLLAAMGLAGGLLGTTYWGLSRVLGVEQRKVELHFERLTGNIHEHERFLLQFIRATEPAPQTAPQTTPRRLRADLTTLRVMPRGDVDIYEGQQFSFSTPFALALPGTHPLPLAPEARERQFGLGLIASSFYSSFWSRSRYPAPQMLLADLDSPAGLAVPSIDAQPEAGTRGRQGFLRVLQAVRGQILADPPRPGVLQVQWRAAGQLLGGPTPELLAYVSDSVPDELWWAAGAPRRTAAAAVLDFDSIDRMLNVPTYEALHLLGPDGRMLSGSAEWVRQYADGIHLTRQGLLVRLDEAGSQGWQAAYLVPYRQVLRDERWAILKWGLGLLSIFGGGWALRRWYRRRVVLPASAAHRALEDSHAFNRAIIETAPVALCVLGDGGRAVITQNALTQAWLGGPGAIAALVRDWHLFEAGAPVRGEACVMAGGLFLHARWAPAQYEGASVLLCAFNDITAHREAESALHQARAAADEANAAKSRFLATMSHEIRTPLYGVVSTLELLGLTPLDARQQGYLHTIRSSSDILLQLISDILDISKIEAGQMPLEAEVFSPLALAEETVRNYAALAHEKGLQLYSCIAADIPASVSGDSTRIRQILGNLISNAIKFTETGRVVLHLRMGERPAQAEGQVRLEWQVVDSGVGIPKEQQARLFEPFYQADEGRHHAVTGTGLGLSICLRLCQMMGGSLDVVSAPGLGSSFGLRLTLQEVESAPALGGEARLPRETIHVRSPSPELTGSLCRWLESWGAVAAPVAPEGETAARTGLLLELLPEFLPPKDWQGVRVLGSHDAELEPQPCAQGWQVNLHSLADLCRALAAAAHGAMPAMAGAQAAGKRPPHRPALGLRVLVAEDNPINRTLLGEQLEQLGCVVVAARNGQEALRCLDEAAAKASHIDIVLTDVGMPVMDGYALTRALRQRDPAIPIIGVTANAMRDEEARCLAAGMNGWLTKPMSLQTLHACLRKAAGPRGNATADGLAQSGPPGPPPAATRATGDGILVPEGLLAVFMNTMREDLEAINAAIGRDDTGAVRGLLHRIRGALAVAQAQELVVACSQTEAGLADGVPLAQDAELHDLVARIETAIQRL